MSKLKKTEEVKQEEVHYPQYLSNKPGGEDLFDGKSQERLANARGSGDGSLIRLFSFKNTVES